MAVAHETIKMSTQRSHMNCRWGAWEATMAGTLMSCAMS
jgi:hypothetical protein